MAEKIGEFLVRIGAMRDHHVKEVLRLQEAGDTRMFGEIALGLGYINGSAIQSYLIYRDKQQGK